MQLRNPDDNEGTTDVRINKDNIDIFMEINKNMPNARINIPETIAHEAFLHMEQDIYELMDVFDKKGDLAADKLEVKQRTENREGYKDHLAMKDDQDGRAKRYFVFISQLKKILNPKEVQKHVDESIKKNYEVGKAKQAHIKKYGN